MKKHIKVFIIIKKKEICPRQRHEAGLLSLFCGAGKFGKIIVHVGYVKFIAQNKKINVILFTVLPPGKKPSGH
jgi:hypothetical protein